MSYLFSNFPVQKTMSKTKDWYKRCIDSVDISGIFNDTYLRSSYKEKITNINLYNGILDPDDLKEVINPTNVNSTSFSTDVKHYPIVNPRINLLVGEEIKRRFEPKAFVANQNAITEKEKERNELVKAEIKKLLESNYEKEELQRKLKNLQKKSSSYQSKRELMANELITYYSKEQNFQKLFNDNFFNAILQGEEYYESAMVGKEPKLLKLNPLNVFWIRSGISNKIQDADLIIINDYWSPGQIIDSYYDDLKPKEIDKLETGINSGGDNDPFINYNERNHLSLSYQSNSQVLEEYIDDGVENGFTLGESKDTEGNIRVLRVYWKSWKKVKIVTYFDKFGNEQEDFFPNWYEVKEDEGEYSRSIWINEWQQGIKIGEDIYIKMGPKEIQYISMSNPSKCYPCISGGTYAVSDSTSVSLMSRVKNYLYLYDVIHERLNELLAANHGKVLEMDLSLIPKGWDVERWFHYLKKMKVAVRDSFKEGQKGQSTGKLAGSMNNASKGYIDLDQGQNIQQHIAYLEFIKQEMSEIIGVSDQRLGQISNRETARGVERSVTQSSHITEWYFSEHKNYKTDAIKDFLEVVKIAYKGIRKKLQYVLSDESIKILDIDGEMLQETDYGIIVSDSVKTEEIEQNLKRLAETALNAGNIEFKDVAKMYFSNSLSQMKNTLENSTDEAREFEMRKIKEAEKTKRQEQQLEAEKEQKDRDLADLKNIRDNKTKILTQTSNLDDKEFEFEKQKHNDELKKFYDELDQKHKQFKEELKVKKSKNNG